MASKHSRPEQSKEEVGQSTHVLRIVLVGKTGVGKSAVGNTILGKQAFKSDLSPSSVTVNCSKKDGLSGGQKVSVVDTPGLFGNMENEKVLNEIKRCICLASPGPHVFLVVLQTGRFTPEESETVKMIQETFGEQAKCYTMVLFTGGDALENNNKKIEVFIGETESLNTIVNQCIGGCHVFNNSVDRPSQVTDLLKKINEMVNNNGGCHYTSEMFQEAERAIEEEKQRIRQKEALAEEEARKKAEEDNNFIRRKKFMGVGSAIGGGIGSFGGPAGFAGGAVVGAAGGAAAAYMSESDKCILQ